MLSCNNCGHTNIPFIFHHNAEEGTDEIECPVCHHVLISKKGDGAVLTFDDKPEKQNVD